MNCSGTMPESGTGNPKLSVILVTYDRAAALARTLNEIAVQSFVDFECLIMDDCSPDNSADICARHCLIDSRFRYIRQPENLRMPANLNVGIRLARGSYVAVLHDDDFLDPQLFFEWVKALDDYPSAGFAFNGYLSLGPCDEPKKLQRQKFTGLINGHKLLREGFFRSWMFGSPVWGTAIIRRKVFDKVGLFDPLYGFFADVEFWMRVCENYDVVCIDKILIKVSVLPSQFERSLWPTEYLIQKIFLQCRKRHFHSNRIAGLIELSRHYVYRFIKGCYWIIVLTKTWRHKELQGVPFYMAGTYQHKANPITDNDNGMTYRKHNSTIELT